MGLLRDPGVNRGDHLLRDFARTPPSGWLLEKSRAIEVSSLPAHLGTLLMKGVTEYL